MYNIVLTTQAVKDAYMLEQSGIKQKAVRLLIILKKNPFQNPPSYEKLKGYESTYSRRINIKHRLVYQVIPNESGETDINGLPYQGIIKIIRMWTHYE
jgi:Txe/YoeB family toxin of toxin-antitoxin system